jgi:hypothetical protein
MGASKFTCSSCRGSGWLCEYHPALPWEHDDCDGAGVACHCNTTAGVPFVQVFIEYDVLDDTAR